MKSQYTNNQIEFLGITLAYWLGVKEIPNSTIIKLLDLFYERNIKEFNTILENFPERKYKIGIGPNFTFDWDFDVGNSERERFLKRKETFK